MVQYSGYATPRLDLGMAFAEYMDNVENYIGMKALATFRTPRKEATFAKHDRAQYLQAADTRRAPRGDYNRSNIKAKDQAYACKERGEEVLLDDSERLHYANDFDAELASSQEAWRKVMQSIETAAAAEVFDGTTNFTVANGYRTDVAAAWSLAATDINADVQNAIEAVRQRTGMKPNTMIVGAGVIPFFLTNDDLINALQYHRLPSVQAKIDSLTAYFGLEQILVGKAVVNTANEGLTAVISDVWSNIWCNIAHVAPEQSPLTTPCIGRTMIWEDDTPQSVMMEEYREEKKRSNVYRARAHTDELLIDAAYGQLLDIAA